MIPNGQREVMLLHKNGSILGGFSVILVSTFTFSHITEPRMPDWPFENPKIVPISILSREPPFELCEVMFLDKNGCTWWILDEQLALIFIAGLTLRYMYSFMKLLAQQSPHPGKLHFFKT